MISSRYFSRFFELIRFYQAAAVNAAFGFGLFTIFLWMGVNMFLAQIFAHCIGVAFNYVTYSKHVFRGTNPAKIRFLLGYVLNYFVGLAAISFFAIFFKSPYLVGFLALLASSVLNYFVLKRIVFVRRNA